MIQTIFNPLSQAKNLAGNDRLLDHLREHPEAVIKGLETIAKTGAKFLAASREAGIDGIFYAVQHAREGMLTLGEYEKFGLPFDRQVLDETKGLWCNMLHLHGSDIHFSLLRHYDFQIVNWHDRETFPSLAEGAKLFQGALCGGIRQDALALEDSDVIRAEAADAIAQTGGLRFILGTGCVVPVIASHGNILAARRSVE